MSQKTIRNEFQEIDASTAEEIDALELNLQQDDDEVRGDEDGTGPIEDDVARDEIEGITEVGPNLDDKGVDNVAPGRSDTSATLRRHRPASQAGGAEDQLGTDQDEPRDEAFSDR